MQLSGQIPPHPQVLEAKTLADAELEQVFNNKTVTQLMTETNAHGFEVQEYGYDWRENAFHIRLKGVTPEGQSFCGDTIQLTAKRGNDRINILDAEIDRTYMQDTELDM